MTLGAASLAGAAFAADAPKPAPGAAKKVWICPPCGCDSDGKDFDAQGACPSCGMLLMGKPPAPPK